jgi:hypothetical protein
MGLMEEPVEDTTLALLADSVAKTRACLAWLDLKQSEWRPGDPPVVACETDTLSQLHTERGRFFSMATSLHDRLNAVETKTRSATGSRKSRRWLLRLERDFHRLDIPKTL